MVPTIACCLLGILLTACKKESPAAAAPTPLAQVGSRSIHATELAAEAARRREAGRAVPDKKTLLDEMVREELLVQSALAAKLDQDPEVQRAYRSALIGTFKERQLAAQLRDAAVTPAEIQARYEANADKFRVPARARVALIEMKRPKVASDERARELLARAREARTMAAATPDGFRAAAARFSEHASSRYQAGDIGWVEKDRPPHGIPAAVIEQACALETNTVSEIIETPEGYYIAKLLTHTDATVQPLERVSDRLRAALLQEKRDRLAAEFDASLRRTVRVELHPAALDPVALASNKPAADPQPPTFVQP